MSALYSKLIDELITKISFMEKGDKLPSERQLCKDYNVSRTTVRNAIGSLVNSGMLYQIQGKGTFVREQNRQNLSNYYSFTEQTKKNGKTPKSIVIKFDIKEANSDLKKLLKLEKEDKIIQFDRLRLADDIAMMYETTIIPYNRFSTINKQLLSKKALYDIFDELFNTKIYQVKESFSVSSLEDEKAQALNIMSKSPCLKIQRESYDIENIMIEYTISYARADKFYYETSYNPQSLIK
ncbi:MAG: GntR family transcriptional regulator [Anaerococcus hydrogenalis]|nr:GntR family transcriptional regulator [Anaerococcus hydrogenalis]